MTATNEEDFLTRIESEWAVDSPIDKDDLVEECYKAPKLHSKYLNYFNYVKKQHIKLNNLYKKKYYQKYHNIVSDRVIKAAADKKQHIEATDEEIIKLGERIDIIELTIKTLESIISSISFRNNAIKNIIEVRKFVEGLN